MDNVSRYGTKPWYTVLPRFHVVHYLFEHRTNVLYYSLILLQQIQTCYVTSTERTIIIIQFARYNFFICAQWPFHLPFTPLPYTFQPMDTSFLCPSCPSSDWNIIKRVFNPEDGEFWTAHLPAPSPNSLTQNDISISSADSNSGVEGGATRSGRVTLEEARSAFQRGGFSLVINRLQKRWRSVADVSLALEDVLGHPVNANMYMTPAGRQGFEAHFDWMDGTRKKNPNIVLFLHV